MQITDNILLKEKITEVIAYFAIYNYPISKEEILNYLSLKIDIDSLQIILNEMLANDELFFHKEYYGNKKDIVEQVALRVKMNTSAKVLLQKSKFYSNILASFPFVEGLAISGSLSKNCAKEQSDIDYFVLTKPNRVWIAKSLIQLYRNILRLFGKEEFMCANYFKATDNISLEEKSKFTEMELITMLPIYNTKTIHTFFKTNDWAFEKYPNLNKRLHSNYEVEPNFIFQIFKSLSSFTLNIFGNFLDNKLMEITKKRWENAHLKNYNSIEDFDKSIKIRKNEIKYHLNSFQRDLERKNKASK